ncbi:MAG: rod shape-determining protein RodA [Thermosulfidibacteraceae bacterium]|jgi:rod shape determining protein RodA
MKEVSIDTTYPRIDFRLILPVFIISLIGFVTLASLSEGLYYFKRQLLWHFIGLSLFLFNLKFFSYQKIRDNGLFFYLFGLLMLVLVLIIGKTGKGAQRWISLGPFSLQPSELAKVALVLINANLLTFYQEMKKIPLDLKDFLVISIPTILYFLVTLLQPDLGTALMFCFISFTMFLFAGIKKRVIAFILVVGVLTSCVGWLYVLKPYQKNRIVAFINPYKDPQGIGYHIIQSKIAIGSGKIFGKGLKGATQSKLNFIPEKHTDFIFASFAEQWGFVGVVFLLFLYGNFLLRILEIAKNVKTIYGIYVSIGIMSIFLWHLFINVGMNMGILPVVGVPLPFMSYGGTSIVMAYISLSILKIVARV